MKRITLRTQRPKSIKYIVGIDEVGRGPLAGPVAVGAIVFRSQIPREFLAARDSKQLSPAARDEWFTKIRAAQRASVLDFKISFVNASIIDRKGIAPAVRLALARALGRLNLDPSRTLVLLDGSLRAPDHFLFQETIIGGDRTEPIISLASIAAKVLRDRRMTRLARDFPQYGFDIHKGYGTAAHIKALKKHGPSKLHRRSFITRLI